MENQEINVVEKDSDLLKGMASKLETLQMLNFSGLYLDLFYNISFTREELRLQGHSEIDGIHQCCKLFVKLKYDKKGKWWKGTTLIKKRNGDITKLTIILT